MEASLDAAVEAKGDTKERLLEAGMRVFADHGFADAGIREICALAGTNPAAVNYHFGDKRRFYAEVLATCHLRAFQRRTMPRLADEPDRPERVLRAWVRWFLEILLVDGAGPLGRLMAREMADPTPTRALEEIAKRSMGPMMAALREVLARLLPDAEPRDLHLVLNSLLGQCLFYKHAQPALERVHRLHRDGELEGDPRVSAVGLAPYDLDLLADHIASFSLAGIRHRGPAGNPTP